MKKTLQTAMTAAMFAASLGFAAGTASASQTGGYSSLPVEQLMNATAGEIVDVYGPPEAFGTTTTPAETHLCLEGTVTLPVTTTDLITDGTSPVVTSTTEEEMVLPGIVPLTESDLNGDGNFDARDLTMLKRYILDEGDGKGYSELMYLADYDYNGIVNKQDLIELILRLTGMPEWKPADPIVTTTTTVTTTGIPTTETTISEELIPVPVYGPPPAYDTE